MLFDGTRDVTIGKINVSGSLSLTNAISSGQVNTKINAQKTAADAKYVSEIKVNTAALSVSRNASGVVTLSHKNTSTQSSMDNSGDVVIQDVSIDNFGHVTKLRSVDLGNLYYTKSQSDGRFINNTSDTMTGTLKAAYLRTSSGGSKTKPSIQIGNKTNTGIYGTSNISSTVDGVERLRVGSSGVDVYGSLTATGVMKANEFRGGLGSSGNPSFTFKDNQSTGMYATNGGKNLKFSSEGRYGLELRKGRSDRTIVHVRDWFTYAAPAISGGSSNLFLDGANAFGVSNLVYRISSSIRYKKDIRPIAADWTRLNPVEYTVNEVAADTGSTGWGFIAEEVHAIAPEAAEVNRDGTVENYKDRHVMALMAKGLLEMNERLKLLEG